jgi:glutamate-1-semialdehyde 2,1-aminomutase
VVTVVDGVTGPREGKQSVTGGIGGTLAANALAARAARATLEHVLTEEAHAHMTALGERYERGIGAGIEETGVPWCVTRLGCRAEYRFQPVPPRNGTESVGAGAAAAHAAHAPVRAESRGAAHAFHNMALMSPATTEEHVDRGVAIFREAASELWP